MPGGPFGGRGTAGPVGAGPSAGSKVGYDTAFAGSTRAGSFRLAEEGRLVVGLDYREGEWSGERCLGALSPVFAADQPPTLSATRVMAPSGYALGALEVRTGQFVKAVRPVFLKVAPGGQLDPADRRDGDWIGAAGPSKQTVLLGGDGRGVIGLHCNRGAVLDGLALIMDRPEP